MKHWFYTPVLLCCLALAAACGHGEAGAPPPQAAADSLPAPVGEWVTILDRGMQNRQRTPERFVTRSDTLRVLTTMNALTSPYVPGLVITNVLADGTSLPVASVRAQQERPDATTVDTAVVGVPRGTLYFFVAEHRGLTDWRVTVQELRPPRRAVD
jgi:hypothetical protein